MYLGANYVAAAILLALAALTFGMEESDITGVGGTEPQQLNGDNYSDTGMFQHATAGASTSGVSRCTQRKRGGTLATVMREQIWIEYLQASSQEGALMRDRQLEISRQSGQEMFA